jgi:hypothetical protein
MAGPAPLTAGRAVLLGHLLVTGPLLIIFAVFYVAGRILAPHSLLWFLLAGFIAAFLWRSFTVPRWRRWALKRGAPPDQMQNLAAATGLVWPKGSVFEKLEFRLPEDQHSREREQHVRDRRH